MNSLSGSNNRKVLNHKLKGKLIEVWKGYADYFITEYRYHPEDYEEYAGKKVYSVKVFIPNISLKRSLAAGWNWISLSAVPPDLSITSAFCRLGRKGARDRCPAGRAAHRGIRAPTAAGLRGHHLAGHRHGLGHRHPLPAARAGVRRHPPAHL